MTRTSLLKCDQCGVTCSAYDSTAVWLWVGNTLSDYTFLTGERRQYADLCSWQCVRDYATVQTLDPDTHGNKP
jgi:hypothetical protein